MAARSSHTDWFHPQLTAPFKSDGIFENGAELGRIVQSGTTIVAAGEMYVNADLTVDMGSIKGVRSSIIWRTCRPTLAYFFMSGLMLKDFNEIFHKYLFKLFRRAQRREK